MALVAVTGEDLEGARRRLVFELRGMLAETDKESLLSVKRWKGDGKSFAHPAADVLPGIQWKLQTLRV
jgi:hypothetical protein